MNENAIFKLSYGVFYLGSEHNQEKNVCVINTVAQVTQEPLRVSITILKTCKTHDIIKSSNKFSVGVMGIHVSMDTINHFGTHSGHTTNKLANVDYKTDMLGNPLIDENCIATLCCKVINVVDIDTHTMFIADLVDADILSDEEPLTYQEYRNIRAGKTKQTSVEKSEQTEQTEQNEIWQCKVCHYIYDGEIPFEDLPDDYVCPVCKKPKSVFMKI